MRLEEYLEDLGMTIRAFSKKVGISEGTIHNILSQKRSGIQLCIAVKIEHFTKNRVTCRELLPKNFVI